MRLTGAVTTITADQRAAWSADGFLCLRGALGPDRVDELSAWLGEVEGWAAAGGPGLHHHELVGDAAVLARSERLVEDHEGFRRFLTEGLLVAWAGALLGEAAVLYKEKVNYKLPGGAGYAPHQDAPAYPFIDAHVSCMVAVDDATVENGCLEVVEDLHHEILPMDDGGCVHPDVVATLTWRAVEVPAGSTLWFHSRTPHRSGPNLSPHPRRALYPTYNARSEGDLREDYYREKLAAFARRSAEGGHTGVSLIGDFQGRPVT